MSEKIESDKFTNKIVVTQKVSIGTLRNYFVVDWNNSVVFVLNDASVTKLVMNHIDSDQLMQMWSDIEERSKAVIFKVS